MGRRATLCLLSAVLGWVLYVYTGRPPALRIDDTYKDQAECEIAGKFIKETWRVCQLKGRTCWYECAPGGQDGS